jgi:hypothetical protein
MSPVTAAGFELSKRVLMITGFAIAALLGYLFLMDIAIGGDIRAAFGRSGGSPSLALEMRTVAQLDQLSADLNAAARDQQSWSTQAAENAGAVLSLLERTPSVPAAVRAEIALCNPPPAADAANRQQTLDACIASVDRVRRDGLEAAQRAAVLESAAQGATALKEHRSGQHSFWLQAGQLILLNLLLPLLTALFGYVFGTQARS